MQINSGGRAWLTQRKQGPLLPIFPQGLSQSQIPATLLVLRATYFPRTNCNYHHFTPYWRCYLDLEIVRKLNQMVGEKTSKSL